MNKRDTTILKGERVKLPTKYGHFELIPFQEKISGLENIALIKGNFTFNDTVLTRIHSACATGDLFGSLKCDCGEQLIQAMKKNNINKIYPSHCTELPALTAFYEEFNIEQLKTGMILNF